MRSSPLDTLGAGLALDNPKGDNHKDADAREHADPTQVPGEKLRSTCPPSTKNSSNVWTCSTRLDAGQDAGLPCPALEGLGRVWERPRRSARRPAPALFPWAAFVV